MSRFIHKTEPVTLVNPMTGKSSDADVVVTFDDLVRALFIDPRVLKKLDVFTAGDARSALLAAHVSDYVEVSEKVWECLKGLILPPDGEDVAVSTAMAYSATAMLRAITDAPTSRP